jgi:hypothetical protein
MKKVLRYSAAGFLIALAYVGWIWFTRRSASQEFDRRLEERDAAKYKQLAPADTTLRITQFYASKQDATRGESVLVCFGVENARSVRIEPPIEQLLPLPSKCFPFAPQRTTKLTLVAEGDKGGEATALLWIKVK